MCDQYNADAKYIVSCLDWLRQNHYSDRKRPLHLAMDNACYQYCAYVYQR
jgi:hypothetical protein